MHVSAFEKCLLFRNKSPCGVLTNREGLFRTHLQRICSFLQKSQKVFFPKKCDFDDKNQVKVKKVLKPKMVPTVQLLQWVFQKLSFENKK